MPVTPTSFAALGSRDPRLTDARVRLVARTERGDRFMAGLYAALARIEDDFAAEVGERRFATFKKVMAELAAQPT